MADITMCQNSQCPLFDSCYRAQAKPSQYRQSYAVFEGGENCDSYIPAHNRELDD